MHHDNNKMTFVKLKIMSCLLLGTLITGHAQDFKADLEKMYQAYRDLANFSVKVDIRVYENSVKSAPSMVHKASVGKQGSSFLITLDHVTMLYTNSLSLIIDPEQKTITCSPSGKNDVKPALSLTGLDSLLKQVDSVKYMGIQNSLKHYTIYTKKNLIKRSDLFISSIDHRMVKVIYDYNYELMKQNTKVVIEYSGFTTTPSFPAGYFSLSRYIYVEKDKIKPTSNYKQYELQLNF